MESIFFLFYFSSLEYASTKIRPDFQNKLVLYLRNYRYNQKMILTYAYSSNEISKTEMFFRVIKLIFDIEK